MEKIRLTVNHNGKKVPISALVKRTQPVWIVCLHGLKSGKELFRELLERPFFENYSIAAFDFAGFGDSGAPQGFSYDIADQAGIIHEAINLLGIRDFYLIGHSLGGMVGTLLLEEFGKRIKGFINMEGNLVGSDCGDSRRIASMTAQRFEGSAAVYRTSVSIVNWSDSEKLLPKFLNAPQRKLYIYGDRNKNKALSLEGKVPTAQIPNAGHFMLKDNPLETYHKIEDFLRKKH